MKGNITIQNTREKTMKIIWVLAYPIMIGQLLHTFMMLVDIWFVSELLGETVTAAVGASTALMGVVRVLPFLLSTGAIALVSQYTGSERPEDVKDVAKNALVLSLVIGLVMGIGLYLNIEGVLGIFGDSSPEVISEAVKYLRLSFISIPFIFFNVTAKAISEATGDTKNPVIIFLIMNGINILLDYVFIVQLNFGIEGASLATLLAEVLGLMLMTVLIGRKLLSVKEMLAKGLGIRIRTCKAILKIGRYSMVQMMVRPITGLIMMRIVLGLGETPAAAFSIGGRLFEFIFIFLKGLQIAVSVLVGQSLGRGDRTKAFEIVRKGLTLAMINMGVFFLLYVVLGRYLMMIFTSSEELIQIGVYYLRICYLGVIFVVFPIVLGGAFTGAGDTMPPMISAIVGNVLVKIPLAIYLGNYTSLEEIGVWIAIALSVVFEAAVIGRWFKKRGLSGVIQEGTKKKVLTNEG